MNPTQQIDKFIADTTGWKGQVLTDLRRIIHEADNQIVEEWKWDVPVFVHKTIVCAISAFKEHVKINFFKGAKLEDPKKLINNGLDSKSHRSIDFKEGDKIDEAALKELIKQAVDLNIKK